MKTKPVLFLPSEVAEYFSFAFSLSFLCSLPFFLSLPGPFDVSVDSLSFRLDELTDLDAQALAQSLFLYQKPKAPAYERARSRRSIFHAQLHPYHNPYSS